MAGTRPRASGRPRSVTFRTGTLKSEIRAGTDFTGLHKGGGFLMMGWLEQELPHCYTVTAWHNNVVVGWVALVRTNIGDPPIIAWFVRKEHRRKGIAKKLTQNLLSWRHPKVICGDYRNPKVVHLMSLVGYKPISDSRLSYQYQVFSR